MDYSLQDMDGASATKLLKARFPKIAVIMLTGSEHPAAYSAAIEAGCSAWVRKTRAGHDLVDAIHRVAASEVVRAEEYEDLPRLNELVVHYQPKWLSWSGEELWGLKCSFDGSIRKRGS